MEGGDAAQERMHDAVAALLADGDQLAEGDVLVGWTVIFDYASSRCGHHHVGYVRGPEPTATEWQQRGLMDMARAMLDAGVTAYEIRNADPEEE
jgi:hypothetical protein